MFIDQKNIGSWFFRSFVMVCLAAFAVAGVLGVKNLMAQTKESEEKKIYTVCARDCDFTSVQAAVDGAAAGDTVQIKGGKYNEEVRIKKNVTLQAYNNKEEIQGSIYFASPSLTVPQRTTVHVSKIIPVDKDKYPEASKKQNTEKVSAADPEQIKEKEIPTISTPLFDVSIQSKNENKTNRDIIITLLIFLVIVLTIFGYFIFGYIVHRKNKSEKKEISSSDLNK